MSGQNFINIFKYPINIIKKCDEDIQTVDIKIDYSSVNNDHRKNSPQETDLSV